MTEYPKTASTPCEMCGGTLVMPQADAQYECQDCGQVVAPEFLD